MSISLSSGYLSTVWKNAVIKSHLKNADLDETDLSNYRPAANLPFPLKVLERIINRQAITNLVCNNLQLRYRSWRSTKTVVLKVFLDSVDALDKGQ